MMKQIKTPKLSKSPGNYIRVDKIATLISLQKQDVILDYSNISNLIII